MASNEKEASLLRGLLARAPWISAQVCGRGLRTASTCFFCGPRHEDKAHVLWDALCPRWHVERDSGSPWLMATAADLHHLGLPEQWPA